MRNSILRRLLVTLLVLLSPLALAAPPTEAERIEAVLKMIEQSKVIFIHNGGEHDAKAAAGHLRSKVKRAGKAVKTFDDFVDGLATKSSMSGKPYQVKLEDGSVEPLAKWLRAQDAAARRK